jgi:hypothetical protein
MWRDLAFNTVDAVEQVKQLVREGKLTIFDVLDDPEFLKDEAFAGFKAVTRSFSNRLDEDGVAITIIKLIQFHHTVTSIGKSNLKKRPITLEGEVIEAAPTMKEIVLEEAHEFGEAIKAVANNKAADERSDILPLLRTYFPHTYYLGNSLTGNTLINNQMAFDFSKEPISEISGRSTFITLTEDWGEDSVHYSRVITAKDNDVLDAVTNLIVAGNEQITPEAVYRFMHGHTKTITPSPQAIGHITKRLDKLRRTFINIDFKEEAQAREKDDTIEKAEYEGYLLPLEKVSVLKSSNKKGGVLKTGYRALAVPPLYDYAKYIQRVISVDTKILELTGVDRNASETFTAIKFYLVRRIEQMKNKNNRLKSNVILYKTIEEKIADNEAEAGTQLSRKARQAIREDVRAWLTKWRDIDGYIKDFTEHKDEAGRIVSVEIVLNG